VNGAQLQAVVFIFSFIVIVNWTLLQVVLIIRGRGGGARTIQALLHLQMRPE
jgi:hypothetical protein